MTKKLVLFLIRRRLGLKKGETFQFVNQHNKQEYYWFGDDMLWKYELTGKTDAHVSLNWLLHDECKIVKYIGLNVGF